MAAGNPNPTYKWQPGQSGNPTGTALKGYQKPSDRIPYLMNKYTWGEVRDICSKPKLLDNLPYIDAHIFARMAHSMAKDGGADMERLWNRAWGTPEATTKVAMLIADVSGTDTAGERALKANGDAALMLAKLGGLVASSGVQSGDSGGVGSEPDVS